MTENELLGYAVTIVITLGAFVAVILRFISPINELRIAIQKLIDSVDGLREDGNRRETRIQRHGEQIDKLKSDVQEIRTEVNEVKTKVDMYHK